MAEWSAQAQALGLPLRLYRSYFAEAKTLYAAEWALIRPDQVVAARGAGDASPARVLSNLLGYV